jgi:hypothetical protein
VRELSRDGAAVFKALADADDDVTIERLLQRCCTPTLGGIAKMLDRLNPHLSAEEIEQEVNRTLSELIKYRPSP